MHRLRHRARRKSKQRKILIISMCSLLLIMTVGYAAMQTNLEIKAKGNIKQELVKPTFEISHEGIELPYYAIITFPEGCGEKYTCSFTKNGYEVPVRVTTVKTEICGSVNLNAKVSDGINTLSETATYNYTCGVKFQEINCTYNTCSAFASYETLDWENTNSFMFYNYDKYPVDMMDDFNAMKKDINSYGTDKAIEVFETVENDNSDVIPFALYDFDYSNIMTENDTYRLEIKMPYLNEQYKNINLIYYSLARGAIDVAYIIDVDTFNKIIEFELEDISDPIIMFFTWN